MNILEVKQKQILRKIAQKYGLELILLFGSRAVDQAYKTSDFDIAYSSKKRLDLMLEAKLITDLMPVFRSEKIDLLNLKNADPLILFAATNSCQVLYERKPFFFAELRVYAFKKYVESKPLYEEQARRIRKRLAKVKV
jgi:predicted nucleotidyltransferase